MASSTLSTAVANKPTISFFERYLTVWMALCILVGIALGQIMPGFFSQRGQR